MVSIHVRVLPTTDGVSLSLHATVLGVGWPGVVQVRVEPSEEGSPPTLSHEKVPVTCGFVPGVVQVSVPSLTDGSPPTLSHEKDLGVGWPGVVQVRVEPLIDGVSLSLHDTVLGVGWPGVVQVRVVPSEEATSPSSQDRFLDDVVVVSHSPVAGFNSPS